MSLEIRRVGPLREAPELLTTSIKLRVQSFDYIQGINIAPRRQLSFPGYGVSEAFAQQEGNYKLPTIVRHDEYRWFTLLEAGRRKFGTVSIIGAAATLNTS